MLNVFTLKNAAVWSTDVENLNDSSSTEPAPISRVSHVFLDLDPHPVYLVRGLTMHVNR